MGVDLSSAADDDQSDARPQTLKAAIERLCALAGAEPIDCSSACDDVMNDFFAGIGTARRARSGSTLALSLAVERRMAEGEAKAIVATRLQAELTQIRNEDRIKPHALAS